MGGNDRSAEQRAWEIIGYLGEVDVNQLDPDGGDAATFERALAEIAGLERHLADANGHVAALTAALTTRRSACAEESERADRAERQLAETRAVLSKVLLEGAAIDRAGIP